MILLMGLLVVIPSIVNAVCKTEITIESKVVIEKNVGPKYEVGYLVKYDFLYTDEELAKIQTTSNTICNIVYIGEDKYNDCSYIIIKDETTYVAGKTVNLQKPSLRYIDLLSPLCNWVQDEGYYCSSSIEVVNIFYDEWYYDSYWIDYGYTYSLDDKQVMNFTNSEDHWDSDGYFIAYAPQTFTMPDHSVLFVTSSRTVPTY